MNLSILISRLFDPIIVLGVTALVAAWFHLPAAAFGRFVFVFFFGIILPPVAALLWAIRKGWVRDWDVSNRKERVPVLAAAVGFLLLDVFLIFFIGNAYLFNLFVIFCFWFIGFFAITLFWKISGHAGAITLACLFALRWFGDAWWPTFFFIPLVCWARVAGKKHTVLQVIGGVIYSWGYIALIRVLGFI